MEEKKKKGMPKWAIILIVIFAIGIVGTALNDDDKSSSNNGSNQTVNKTSKENKYELNKPFKFDDLEITIGNEVNFVTLDNEFSEHNGKDVVKIPITVKNLKDESHQLNMFYIKTFGSSGTELADISSYFSDEDGIEFAGELMPNASYTKYLYFLYDGNGTYVIKLDNYSQKIEIKLDITK